MWTFTPPRHKTRRHGKTRVIYIGPKAQEVLRAYLRRPDDWYCFAPAWKRSGPRYTTDSYRRAIHRACERQWNALRKEFLSKNPGAEFNEPLIKWSPNQLRHTAGTSVRAAFGAEHAQAILGHSNLSTTEIYAKQSEARAHEAAKRLG